MFRIRDTLCKVKSDIKLRFLSKDEAMNNVQTGPKQPIMLVFGSGTSHPWIHLRSFSKSLKETSKPLSPLAATIAEFLECVDDYDQTLRGWKEYETIYHEFEYLFQTLQYHCAQDIPSIVATIIQVICDSMLSEIADLRKSQDKRKRNERVDAGQNMDAILTHYRRIRDHLQRILLNLNAPRQWIENNTVINDWLNQRLLPVLSAYYNSSEAIELKRGPCTKGTRVELINQIHDWAKTPDSGPIYWLNGMAGTGKTTIAYSLCEKLDATRGLAASFFCTRLQAECRDTNRIIPSIAYQLARFSYPFGSALLKALETNQDASHFNPRRQFETLILQPLAKVKDMLSDSLTIVIDGLDECEDMLGIELVLDVLLKGCLGLPVKFIVSSRPEANILGEMMRQDIQPVSRVALHELDRRTVQRDIRTYLHAALAPLAIDPAETEISRLAERAGVMFLYAAVAVRYISHDRFRQNPRARLHEVLESPRESGKVNQEIYALYTAILDKKQGPDMEEEDRINMRLVLSTVLCAKEPLTTDMLSKLLKVETVRVHNTLHPLRSVLHIAESNGLVTTLHPSFPDFLLDPLRSKQYYCDSQIHNQVLAQHCFDILRNTLQFNICNLESSYKSDDQVEGLEERVGYVISPELFYASRYWAFHLHHTPGAVHLTSELEEFLSVRLLFWMEVMNLKKCAKDMPQAIRLIETSTWAVGYSAALGALIRDAWQFTSTFSLNAVSDSTPHIYTSMLPSWPKSRPISKLYAAHAQGIIRVKGTPFVQQDASNGEIGGMFGEHYDAMMIAAFSPDYNDSIPESNDNTTRVADANARAAISTVAPGDRALPFMSIALSPDGSLIASSSSNDALSVWDAMSGRLVTGPLKGHSDLIMSVAFSPSGALIASGSLDGTLIIWDLIASAKVTEPLKGHSNSVMSVAFSPDGASVASGSLDQAIIIWTIATTSGDTLKNHHSFTRSLTGHKKSVMSVAFSPMGDRIASGSADKRILLWDVETGNVIAALEGHSDSVMSVAFSPNNYQLASGSLDTTIRIWDTITGGVVIEPLQGHTNRVHSISYSPDGTQIVSGSYDCTVRVWGAETGAIVSESSKSHADSVMSALFSPDGRRIISSSCDGSIVVQALKDNRMIPLTSWWRAQSDTIILQQYEGHTDSVRSVAFSPDGSLLVSGSHDSTIRIWDVVTGMTDCLQGHTNSVWSVRFSHDGTRLVSGSLDSTCIIWDVKTRRAIHNPFKGHRGLVASVAFSPDDTRVVSGSSDRTVQVQDANTGIAVGSFIGHTDIVWSVDFSPNGSLVVSGSQDRTIIVWDAITGAIVLGPLKRHLDSVMSVRYSPNGKHIASASGDKTILVWDAQDGNIVHGPLKGHLSPVTSVAFSPDGTRISSGSGDKTIRLWDYSAKGPLTTQIIEHTAPVWSVAFSPDGTSIAASASGFPIAHPNIRLFSLSWRIQPNGWITSYSGELLLWVPPNASQSTHMLDYCDLLIPKSTLAIGETWTGCFSE